MQDTQSLSPTFAVCGQLSVADIEACKAAGFNSVINNRPDDEEVGQPSNQILAHAAQAAGLGYVHIPIAGMPVSAESIEAMREALDTLPAPVLAFCRSGKRSSYLWQQANSQ